MVPVIGVECVCLSGTMLRQSFLVNHDSRTDGITITTLAPRTQIEGQEIGWLPDVPNAIDCDGEFDLFASLDFNSGGCEINEKKPCFADEDPSLGPTRCRSFDIYSVSVVEHGRTACEPRPRPMTATDLGVNSGRLLFLIPSASQPQEQFR